MRNRPPLAHTTPSDSATHAALSKSQHTTEVEAEMELTKRVSKRQPDSLAEWHKQEQERRQSEKMKQELKTATGKKRRRLQEKMKLETAAPAKKRARPTGARGVSKSEPAKKKRKVSDVSHESTPRAHSDGRAKRTETGKRVPMMRVKGAKKDKKVQVKFEMPAVPPTQETPVAQPNESTTNSKEGRLSKLAGIIKRTVKYYSPRLLLFDDLVRMVEVVEPRFSQPNFESFAGMGHEEFFQRYSKSVRVIKSGGHLHLEWSGVD